MLAWGMCARGSWSRCLTIAALLQACVGDWTVRSLARDGGSRSDADLSELPDVGAAELEDAGTESHDGAEPTSDDGTSSEPVFELTESMPAAAGIHEDVDGSIRIVLSDAPDPSTVTAQTFRVTRDDQPVSGKLAVNGAEIEFTPSATWPLGAAYQVALAGEIRRANGSTLQPKSFEFSIREGAWSPQLVSSAHQEAAGSPGTGRR